MRHVLQYVYYKIHLKTIEAWCLLLGKVNRVGSGVDLNTPKGSRSPGRSQILAEEARRLHHAPDVAIRVASLFFSLNNVYLPGATQFPSLSTICNTQVTYRSTCIRFSTPLHAKPYFQRTCFPPMRKKRSYSCIE